MVVVKNNSKKDNLPYYSFYNGKIKIFHLLEGYLLKEYNRLKAIGKKEYEIYFEIGKSLDNLNHLDEALKHLESASIMYKEAHEGSEYDDCLLAMAKVCLKRNEIDKALNLVNKITNLKNDDYFQLKVLIMKKKFELLKDSCEESDASLLQIQKLYEQTLEEGFEQNKENLELLLSRAEYYATRKEEQAILKAFESYDYYIYRYLEERVKTTEIFFFKEEDQNVYKYAHFLFVNGYFELAIDVSNRLINYINAHSSYELNKKITKGFVLEAGSLPEGLAAEEEFKRLQRYRVRKYYQKLLSALYEVNSMSNWAIGNHEEALKSVGYALKYPLHNEHLIEWRKKLVVENSKYNGNYELVNHISDIRMELEKLRNEQIEKQASLILKRFLERLEANPNNMEEQNEEFVKFKALILSLYGINFNVDAAKTIAQEKLNKYKAGLYNYLSAFDENCKISIANRGFSTELIASVSDSIVDAECIYSSVMSKTGLGLTDSSAIVFSYFKALEVFLVKWIGEAALGSLISLPVSNKYKENEKNKDKSSKFELCEIGNSHLFYNLTTLGNIKYYLNGYKYNSYKVNSAGDPLKGATDVERDRIIEIVGDFINLRNDAAHKKILTVEYAKKVREAFYNIIGEFSGYFIKSLPQKMLQLQ